MKPDFMQQCYAKFVTPEKQEFIKLNVEVANRIYDILDERELTQRDFARMMGKTEAEVSRWLSGTHNFTMATIAAINMVLGENVLEVPRKQRFQYISFSNLPSSHRRGKRTLYRNYNFEEDYLYAYEQ